MGHSEFSPRSSQRGTCRGINDRRGLFAQGSFSQRMNYTPGEACLRLRLDELEVMTRLMSRTCFANPLGSIKSSRQFASCHVRPGLLLSHRGTSIQDQSFQSIKIYLHDLCSIVIRISVICTVALYSAIGPGQKTRDFTEWPP